MNDELFMKEALKEAMKAYKEDEVPVGCVIVKDDKIIARGHNQKEKKNNAILHAEIVTLTKAQKKLNDWLVIKKEFRLKKYASYQRSERLLLRLCAPYLINFSLLPSVVGWPIEGRGYDKPLFIWQAYVVLCIMSNYEEQEVFTLSDLQ